MYWIQQDLGDLIVAALRANIGGPMVVPPNTVCHWQAHAHEGNPPYAYAWRKTFQVIGTTSDLFLNTGAEEFDLYLDVTDEDSSYYQTYIHVTIDPDGSCSL